MVDKDSLDIKKDLCKCRIKITSCFSKKHLFILYNSRKKTQSLHFFFYHMNNLVRDYSRARDSALS